ncbi:MAG: ATP phosphoribosyltransferase regulatory subunit [Fusobacteriota bacterium]
MSLIPEGVKIYFGKNMDKKKKIEDYLKNEFENSGYRFIEMPNYEYYEDIKENFSDSIKRNMFKFEDKYTGKVLALRPDMTSILSKLIKLKSEDIEFPERIYYLGNIFEHGKMNEKTQAGIELIGSKNKSRSDLEILAMALELMKKLSIPERLLEIGDIRIFDDLMKKLSVNKKDVKKIKKYLMTKNVLGLEKFVKEKGYDEIISRLPYLIGEKNILKEIKKYIDVDYLEDILNKLDKLGYKNDYILNLGMVKEMSYYTGIVFNGISSDNTDYILSGGRYDKLMEVNALGFVVNIDMLVSLTPDKEEEVKNGYYIMGKNDLELIKKKNELIGKGKKVEICTEKWDVNKARDVAGKKGYKYVIDLNKNKEYNLSGDDNNDK